MSGYIPRYNVIISDARIRRSADNPGGCTLTRMCVDLRATFLLTYADLEKSSSFVARRHRMSNRSPGHTS